jgi:hypothetical protein
MRDSFLDSLTVCLDHESRACAAAAFRIRRALNGIGRRSIAVCQGYVDRPLGGQALALLRLASRPHGQNRSALPDPIERAQMPRSPLIVRTVPALRRALDSIRAKKATIALVPTMGALHDGHVSLVRLAKRRATKVIVSIFVNPTQFAPTEDFSSYPRTWKADVAKLAAEDVDLIWNPDVKTMYPLGFATRILTEGPATAGLEDRIRPHFFGGVTTVVGKLFTQCRPDFADGGGSRPRRQGDRLANRARTRRPRDVFAQCLSLAGSAPDSAGTVPRDEGKRPTLARRRRPPGRDGRRR